MRFGQVLAASTFALALATGCGGSGDDDATNSGGNTDPVADTPAAGPTSGADSAPDPDAVATDGPTSNGEGRLVLEGETIEFDEVLCMLEPQEAAAGGGKILFVGQGMGVDSEGQDVLLDVSRYDDDSQFAGDVVSVEIGDLMAGDNTSLESRTSAGTVEVEGSTMRAEVTLTDFTDSSELAASFELSC